METLFPQKESSLFQHMFVKHALEEGRGFFLLEAPHLGNLKLGNWKIDLDLGLKLETWKLQLETLAWILD